MAFTAILNEGSVVAQLLTPEPDHRLLLLAPAMRLRNQTAINSATICQGFLIIMGVGGGLAGM